MDEPVQVVQTGTIQAVVDCLRNEIILREIFGHLSSSDLIQLSCVNKLWNREARIMMRERGNVVAKVHKQDLCVQAEALGLALESMNVVPFAAIDIYLPSDFVHDDACRCGELRRIRPQNLSPQFAMKRADIVLRGPWWSYQNCPAVQLVKIVLQHCSGTLEKLELEIELRQEDFIQQLLQEQNCRFPRLTCLGVPVDDHFQISSRAYVNYIKPLVSRAPNLQKLYIAKLDHCTEQVLEGCRAGMIEVGSRVSAPFNHIPENFVNAVKLGSVELLYTGPAFNFARFNRIAPVLLAASYETLDSLDVCPLLLPSLMSYGVRLESVTEFSMDINFEELELAHPEILGILRNFDFTRILPRLETVTIDRGHIVPGPLPNQLYRMIEEVEAILREPQPNRVDNIKELILNHGLYQNAPEFWARTFPKIRELRLGEDQENFVSEDFPIASIWEHFPDVEELEVSLRDMRGILPSADSAFCGIFPEECARLREEDEEYLESVNIVPVKPAINCFRNLKKLILDYYTDAYAEELSDPESSKLTKLIAFARRRPNLAITFRTRRTAVYEALKHMEPYASVELL